MYVPSHFIEHEVLQFYIKIIRSSLVKKIQKFLRNCDNTLSFDYPNKWIENSREKYYLIENEI